jgi:hypothetical protein
MTNNQLIVPETSEESNGQSNQLLQQVLDNPHELAPSVQVRFAKRVGRPGASRVMMMDAQTCGPIGEQDEDSESKLALRLADGTNVQLSLSFFNDNQPALANVGGGGRRTNFTPFNTYVYEPRTYTIHKSESKLPLIMMTTAIVLGATCYGLITGPLSNYFQTKATKPAMAPVVAKAAVAKPVVAQGTAAKTVTSQHAAPKIAHEAIPEAPATTSERSNSFATTAKKALGLTKISHHHHSAQMQFANSGHSTRNEMFVPPPPPMAFSTPPSARGFVPPPPPTPYTMPVGIPAAFDPLQSLAPAVAHSNRVYTPAKKLEPVSFTSSAAVESKAPVQQFSPRVERAFDKPATVQDFGNGGGQPLLDEQGLTAPIK